MTPPSLETGSHSPLESLRNAVSLDELKKVVASATDIKALNAAAKAVLEIRQSAPEQAKAFYNSVQEQTSAMFNAALDRLGARGEVEAMKQVSIEKSLLALENRYNELLAIITPHYETGKKTFMDVVKDPGALFAKVPGIVTNMWNKSSEAIANFATAENMERMMYSTLTLVPIPFLPFIKNFAERAIAALDVRKTIKEAGMQASLIFSGKFTDAEWQKFSQLKIKDPSVSISTLVYDYIQKLGTVSSPMMLTLGQIMNADKLVTNVVSEQSKLLAERVRLSLPMQKAGITSVVFGGETSIDNGVLAAKETDFKPDGSLQEYSTVTALLAAKDAIPEAAKIMIGDAAGSNIDWSTKTVLLPVTPNVSMEKIRELLLKKPATYTKLVISADAKDMSVTLRKSGSGVSAYCGNNDNVIKAILAGELRSVSLTEQTTRKVVLKGSGFTDDAGTVSIG